MAVRRRRRRVSHGTSTPSSQRSWLNLTASLGALVMVLALGDKFASSAAGCYGAVAQQEEGVTEASTSQVKKDSPSPSRPAFLVITPDTVEGDPSDGTP